MLITHISTCFHTINMGFILHALQAYITPSINHIRKDNLVSLTNCGINNPHSSLKRAGTTQKFEYQIPFTSIWLNFRLKELFIESKNSQIEVQMRKLCSSEVEAADSHGCAKIVQTLKPSITPTANTRTRPNHNSSGLVPRLIIHGYG